MPPSRKSCERCRMHKAKCIWLDGSTRCVRCDRLNSICSAPSQQAAEPRKNASFRVGKIGSRQDHDEARTGTSPGHRHRVIVDNGHPGSQSTSSTPAEERTSLQSEQSHDLPPRKQHTSTRGPRADTSLISLTHKSLPSVKQLPLVSDSCKKPRCYLPPAEEGYQLLQDYLYDFNSKIPLFSPEGLYDLFHDCYSGAAGDTALAWSAVYATIGTTYRLRAIGLFAAPDDASQAEWYLSRIVAKLPDLMMQSPSLRLVQTALSIGMLLQTSSRFQRAAVFISTALHMARDLGYNETTPEQATSSLLDMEKSYVFWIAFFMDAHISVANQRPSAQHLADIATPAPADDVVNWWQPGQSNNEANQWSLNVFALHCKLAIIEADAAEELLSVKARRRSRVVNNGIYDDVISKLQDWRKSNPLSSLDAKDALQMMYRSDIFHSIILEAAYLRTLYQLHATHALTGFSERVDVFATEALQSMIELDNSHCYDEAERFLRLVVLMPQSDLSTIWISFQAILAALCTVLSMCIRDKVDSGTPSRIVLHLCKDVLDMLVLAVEQGAELAHAASIDVCREIYLAAQNGA